MSQSDVPISSLNPTLSLFKGVAGTLKSNTGKGRCGMKNGEGSRGCDPCGINTRCISCYWCITYCPPPSRSIMDPSLVATPYRKAFIEMFEDMLSNKIKNYFNKSEIEIIMKETSAALKEDTEMYNHNNNEELISVANFIESFNRNLQIYKEKDVAKTNPG